MHTPPALRLAGDIAAQFGYLSPDRAAARVAEHIGKFWDPRMQVQLRTQVADAGPSCDPVLADVIRILDAAPE